MKLPFLLWTLRIKMVLTLSLWALPLLLLPASVATTLGLPLAEPPLFSRLLGCAYTALLVGYWKGHSALQASKGLKGTWVIDMGLVSNGLATIILLLHGFSDAFSTHPLQLQGYLIASGMATGGVTVALWWFGKRHINSEQP